MSNMLLYENWNDKKVEGMLENYKDYFDVLKWTFKEYGKDIVYACSFGAEGIVLIDLISKVNKSAKIIFLDTELHFQETYDLIEKVKERYPSLQITKIKPVSSLDEQAKWYGDELWKHHPNLCCHMRKVVPLKEALKNTKAWISGLRREQSTSRSKTQYINKDDKFQKIKICPLIHWSWEEILTYIELNNLPYNSLHDKEYPSIGCAPCTQPVSKAENQRAGRWAGSAKSECGLHQNLS